MIGILLGIARLIGGVAFFLLIWPVILVLVLTMIWWNFIGAVAWLGGRRVRFHAGRWLGAYPFSLWVVVTLAVAALLHCCLSGVWNRVWFRQAAEDCVSRLETIDSLKPIGGLW